LVWHDHAVASPGSSARDGAPPRFDAVDVRRYYDRHTTRFVAFGTGGDVGTIHRAVWAPGVQTREQAFHHVDELIAARVRALDGVAGQPHVVDLGCGIGASLCFQAERAAIRGTGITISPRQVRLAEERIQRAGLSARVVCLEASFDDIPSSVPAADLAYAIESFAHAPHPARFFDQCARLIRPGGVLIVCDDFLGVTGHPRAAGAVRRFVSGWHLNSVLAATEVREMAENSGFSSESSVDLSPYLGSISTRDRWLDGALGWLPLSRTPLGPVLGGAALQACLTNGWVRYELLTFVRRT
jgi:SAM-dependent methyltransferase